MTARLALPRPIAALPMAHDLAEFWPAYLWHHRRPWTRRLHHLASWICIGGAVLALATGHAGLLPAGIAAGYLVAFASHWLVEHNRPLSFGRPIFAGICNWIMFALEITGRLDRHLLVLQEKPREEWDDYDVGSQ